MVHSSSEPSMPTTPSAPPAPQVVLLQVPLTGHDLNQAPAKLLTPTRTSSSVLNQPPTQSLVQVKQPAPTPAITPAKAQSLNSCPTSPLSPTPTPAPPPSQGTVNGRTSGRKRTPKACDCCGPHGRGHNDASSHIKTPGRGRGRGGGRGRGTLREDTPKRDGRGRPRKIKILEIIDDEEDEDGDDQDDDKPMTTVAELAADAVDQSGIHNDASLHVKTPGRGRGRGRGRGGGRGRGRGTLPEMGRNLDGTPKKAGRGRPKKIKIFEISDDDEDDEDSDDQDDDKPMTTVAELAADAVDQSGILGDVSITTALGKEQTVGMGRGAGNKGEMGVKVTRGRGASAGRARGIGAPGAAVNSKMDVNVSILRGGGRGVVSGRGGVGMRGRGVRGQGSVSVGVRGQGVRGRGGIGLRGHCIIGRGSIGVGVRGQGVRGRGSIGVGVRGQGVRGRGSIGVGLRGQGVRGRGSIGVGARGQGVRGQSSAGVRGQGVIGRGRVATGSVGVGIQRVVSSNFGGQTGSGSAAQSKNTKSMPVPTREDVDMEVEERANSTSPPENGNGVGDTVVKSACVGTTASGTGSAGGTATAGTRGGGTDNGFIAKSQVTEHACGDSLSGSGPVTDSTSTSESPKEPDTAMQIDSQSPNDKTLPVPLSNGNVSTLTDEHCRPSPAENSALSPDMVSPPSKDCIVVHTTQHRWALKDHRLYCLPGTWEKEEEEKQGKEPSEQTDGQQTEKQTDGQSQEKDDADSELTEMIHEFLESFYTKYGSFIPLSETDVVEHLKKKGNCDLSNRKLNIPAEVSRYKAGLASAPVGGFMVTYNKHTLSLEDLSTLDEQNWLNDQIINMYGELIMEATQHKVHFFNSFFHRQLVAKGYEGVKRWTKKEDLFSKQLLLVPIHLEIHWSLIAVDIATKTISYYDSQGIVFKHTIDNIMKYIQAEAKEKEQTDFQKGWKMVIIKGIPQQKNDSDCGVFVLEYCRRLSVKQPLRFSQEDMPRIRKRLYKELCECRLNDC